VTHLAPLCLALSLLAAPLVARQKPGTGENPSALPCGAILPRIVATTHPEQSYALYLPSRYAPEKRWPIIYAFDPGASGSRPVELMKDAAERYGYILAGSNNSRNGPWKISAEAAQAMLRDTHQRLALDDRRMYFAGFSGGARVAAQLAQVCKCAIGVLLSGAGFQPKTAAPSDERFAVFATTGTYDFNYGEIVRTDEELEKSGYPHFLRRFDGPHQWAPANTMEEALAWFRLQAMKSGREVRDDSFIAAQAAQETERARALDQSGNLYAAWNEYRQGAEMLDGLIDIAVLRARAEALEKDKAIREGAKREKQDFEEQQRLTQEMDSGLSALQENRENRGDIRAQLERQIVSLRGSAEREKREDKLLVLKRALAGVLGEAMDMGIARLDQKDVHGARDYFELAGDANPDSVWALTNIAVVRAMDGDKKGTLEALRHARAKTQDSAKFSAWLKEEAAFAKLRGTPEFDALLEPAPHL
jgi:tetratricopeptide (TPR) repeat protein